MPVVAHKITDDGIFSLKQDPGQCSLCSLVFKEAGGKLLNANVRRKLKSTEQLYLEVNRLCNLRCTHCYNDSGPGHHEHLPLEDIQTLLTWIKTNKAPIKYILVSGGEPTLHPNFLEIVSLIRELSWNAKVITNGTTISLRLAQVLARLGAHVQVSLTGHSIHKDAHLRGIHSFQGCINGIERLLEAGIESKLSVSVVVHRHNFDTIGEIIDLLAGLGVKRIGLSTLAKQGRGVTNWSNIAVGTSELMEASLAAGRKRRQYGETLEIYTSGLVFISLPYLLRGEPPPVLPCTAHLEACVTYTGDLYVCEHFQRLCMEQEKLIPWREALYG